MDLFRARRRLLLRLPWPGKYDCLIWQRKHFYFQRAHNFFHRAAPQIGAADASLEKSVAGEKQAGIANYIFLARKIKTHAALRVSGRVHHAKFVISPLDGFAFGQEFVNSRRVPASASESIPPAFPFVDRDRDRLDASTPARRLLRAFFSGQ